MKSYKNSLININIEETNIKLVSDIITDTKAINSYELKELEKYILNIRKELKKYIIKNPSFLSSLEPIITINDEYSPTNDKIPQIIKLMYKSSQIANVGPMASVAGSISEIILDYLIEKGTEYSIINNGGDIGLINKNKAVICGIYSGNTKNTENIRNIGNIGFKIKKRKSPLGIASSSGKIGHSISFGDSDSVTVISKKASISDGLATSIANDVKGINSEEAIQNGLESAEKFKEDFIGALIIIDDHIGTIGKLPEIIATKDFDIDY
ncbi:MAG: UPF0280 family protein [Methanobacteriaceae archaeon]